ncbi:hypothetical protein [Halolamina sp.]|jgi:hypothetical protein|uniref:DUF7346 family protein n=1 Tax=Halolamina sp. TaxID=1940283 RepID=UPI000223B741|nr:hypothetical protein Halar_1307 [halophilic archaeon DL31]
MRTVESDEGKRYLLLKESSDASLVRDPDTGEERYVDAARLGEPEGDSPLTVAASGVAEPVRRLVTAVHDERSLGLVMELADRGPVPVVDLLAAYDLCESDFHGLLTELRAAGLVREETVAGERGYDATTLAREAVDALRAAE